MNYEDENAYKYFDMYCSGHEYWIQFVTAISYLGSLFPNKNIYEQYQLPSPYYQFV
jgi:hypothetical protein